MRHREAACLRGSAVRFLIAAGLLLLAGLGLLLSHWFPEWVSGWFLPFSQWICGVLSAATGLLPFSLAEALAILLPLGAAGVLLSAILRGVFYGQPGRRLLRWGAHVLLITGALCACFVWFWAMAYQAPSLLRRLDYPEPDRSPEALYEVCLVLEQELNALSHQVPRDSSGNADFGSFSQQAAAVSRAAGRFFDETDGFYGSTAPVKPVAHSEFLSQRGITGIYICLTGESNVNTGCPDCILPFTMAHEMAHRSAVAPEEEANFTAFLLCRKSDDVFVRYSGVYQTFIYCYNALARVSSQLQHALYDQLSPEVLQDFSCHGQWVRRYDGPRREQAQQVNDTYLKAMNQPAGVDSYGQVVDLVLAWYQKG